MKLKIYKRLINILIIGGIVTINGCSEYEIIKDLHEEEETEKKEEIKPVNINIPYSEPTIIETVKTISDNTISVNEIATTISENTVSENNVEETFEWDKPKYNVYVRGINDTPIYADMNVESEKLGELERHDRIKKTDLYYDDYYEVEYNDTVGYVLRKDTKVDVRNEFDHSFIKVVKIKKDANIYMDPSLKIKYTTYKDNFEIAEVYQEHEDVYLVKTIDYVGYVNKNDTEDILDETFIVVDKSEQNMLVYHNGEIVIDTPIVSGLATDPECDTPLGEYAIYYEGHDRDLSGPGYCTHVDTFWAFLNGYGIHDSKRPQENFDNKKTYKTNGSHGCFNTEYKQIQKMKNYVKVGTGVYITP